MHTKAEETVEHRASYVIKSSHVLCGMHTKAEETVEHRASYVIKSSHVLCGMHTKDEETVEHRASYVSQAMFSVGCTLRLKKQMSIEHRV